MNDLNAAIADNHKAVDEFTATARAIDAAGRSTRCQRCLGAMRVAGYLRLQAIPARPNRAQFPGAAATVSLNQSAGASICDRFNSAIEGQPSSFSVRTMSVRRMSTVRVTP